MGPSFAFGHSYNIRRCQGVDRGSGIDIGGRTMARIMAMEDLEYSGGRPDMCARQVALGLIGWPRAVQC